MKKSVVVSTGISLLVLGLAAQVALAAKVVDVSGTSWTMVSTVKFSLKKVNKVKESGLTTLFIGPNGAEGIGAGEFKYGILVGTYADPKSNGNLVMEVDIADLEQSMSDVQEMLEEKFTTVEDVSWQITKFKISAKVKPGKGARLKSRMKFDVQAVVDGEPWKSKGTLSAKGKYVDF